MTKQKANLDQIYGILIKLHLIKIQSNLDQNLDQMVNHFDQDS